MWVIFVFLSDELFSFLALQVSQTCLWIIQNGLQATTQCVDCSLKTALSELLTHTDTQIRSLSVITLCLLVQIYLPSSSTDLLPNSLLHT